MSFQPYISNAIKYNKDNAIIEIDIQDRAGSQVVSVKDPGGGIYGKDKKNIFERFERLEREKTKGAGPGLTIAKRIVEMHEGEIWVEDNPVGHLLCGSSERE